MIRLRHFVSQPMFSEIDQPLSLNTTTRRFGSMWLMLLSAS
jgi:hypothetical protein